MSKINVNMPAFELGNRDVVFEVHNDEGKTGALKVSRGTVEWVPRDHTYGFHLNWPDLASLMQEQGRKR
jgi:hypothetical protein